MKNTKKLSVILALSMLASTIPAIAGDPGTGTGAPVPTFQAGQNSTAGSNEESSGKFLPGLSEFYTKYKKYAGIAIGAPLAGYLAYKFIPGICKFLTPISVLTLLLMKINSSAAKPENKEFSTLFGNIQMKAVSAFESAKNYLKTFFSNKK